MLTIKGPTGSFFEERIAAKPSFLWIISERNHGCFHVFSIRELQKTQSPGGCGNKQKVHEVHEVEVAKTMKSP